MRHLFQSGAAFLIIAGISFLAAAITGIKYLLTGSGSATSGGTVAMGVVFLAIGIAVKRKNTQ